MADRLLPDLYSTDWTELGTGGSRDSSSDIPFGPPTPAEDTDTGSIDYTDDDPRGGDPRPAFPKVSDDDDDRGDIDRGKLIDRGIGAAIDVGKTIADAITRDREADRKAQIERDKIEAERERLDRREREIERERQELRDREERRRAEEEERRRRAEDRAWRDRTPESRGDSPPVRGPRPPKDQARQDLNDRVRAALRK